MGDSDGPPALATTARGGGAARNAGGRPATPDRARRAAGARRGSRAEPAGGELRADPVQPQGARGADGGAGGGGLERSGALGDERPPAAGRWLRRSEERRVGKEG